MCRTINTDFIVTQPCKVAIVIDSTEKLDRSLAQAKTSEQKFEILHTNLSYATIQHVSHLSRAQHIEQFISLKYNIIDKKSFRQALKEIIPNVTQQVVLILFTKHYEKIHFVDLEHLNDLDDVRKILTLYKQKWSTTQFGNIKLSSDTVGKIYIQGRIENEEKNEVDQEDDTRCLACNKNKKRICMAQCGHISMCANCLLDILYSHKHPACPACQIANKEFVLVYD
jgi:hypothetical protein